MTGELQTASARNPPFPDGGKSTQETRHRSPQSRVVPFRGRPAPRCCLEQFADQVPALVVGTDRIFNHDRSWLLHQVKRICRLAGVPEISAHGLRGTHADLCLHAHVTALAVSQALGHTSTEVTFGHYADRGIVDQQQHAQALSVLATTVPSHQN